MRLRAHRGDRVPAARRRHRVANPIVGAVLLAAMAAAVVVIAQRNAIFTSLKSGSILRAEFSRQYLLLPNQTEVKVAGVPIGVVTGVTHNHGGASVTMKIFGDNIDKLGTQPKAAIGLNAPLLSGKSYILLTPGGSPGRPDGSIPVSRTTVPVYLDSVLAAIPPPAQQGIKQFIHQTDASLLDGGRKSLSSLLATAPGSLAPASTVLQAAQGNQPGDLTQLVADLDATASTLTANPGQIQDVVSRLDQVSSTLAAESPALSSALALLPEQLARARGGLQALGGTLDALDASVAATRPIVENLGQLVDQSQPTLAAAAPVLGQLEPLLRETVPVLGQLLPASTSLTTVVNDVRGPVIHRILNPLIPDLKEVNHAVDQPPSALYQELGYVIEGLDGVTSGYDSIDHTIVFNIAFNQANVTGAPFSPLVQVGQQACVGGPCPNGVQPPGVNP